MMKITDANLEEVLTTNPFKSQLVVVDCWAEWCGPCRMYGPIFEEVSKEFDDMIFAKLNADTNPAICEKYNISAIPTTLIFDGNSLIRTLIGVQSKEQLRAQIAALRA